MGEYDSPEEAIQAAKDRAHEWDNFTIVDGFTFKVVEL
jgi:hypothetical protein